MAIAQKLLHEANFPQPDYGHVIVAPVFVDDTTDLYTKVVLSGAGICLWIALLSALGRGHVAVVMHRRLLRHCCVDRQD